MIYIEIYIHKRVTITEPETSVKSVIIGNAEIKRIYPGKRRPAHRRKERTGQKRGKGEPVIRNIPVCECEYKGEDYRYEHF